MRFLSIPFILCMFLAASARAGDWPTWRGPNGDCISDEKDPPISWTADENVTWFEALPGGGNSTPIVWGDRVFCTYATVVNGPRRCLICFDRKTGKAIWQGEVKYEVKEPTHDDNPYCASSPITDGKDVYAWFGSAGIAAYEINTGKELWKVDLGKFEHIWGNASSPILYKDNLILSAGPGTRCFLVALNKQTGKEAWRRDLPDAVGKIDEYKGSWSSPVLTNIGEMPEMILALPNYLAAFNPENGEELWRCRGLTALSYANPLVGKEAIVAMSGYGGAAIGMRAPKAADRGDLTESHRLWVVAKNSQRIGSGIMIGNRVYIMNESGVAQCFDAMTGKDIWKARAAGSTWGSTVLVDGKFFTTDQSGETIVWQPGDELKVLHQNPLKQKTRGTPAFSDGQVFIHTYEGVYCIGKRHVAAP